MHKELKNHFSTADAIAKLLEPYVEVVIHELETETIAYIANNFSNRAIGDPSLLSTIGFLGKQEQVTIGPYEKVNWNGQKLKSISNVLRSAEGKSIGLLCINLDVSDFYRIQKTLQFFVSSTHLVDQPEELFKEDWHEKINLFIYGWTKNQGVSVETLNRNQKRALIRALSDNGAFSRKNAAIYIARILNMSRATVYNYLKHQKERTPQTEEK